MLRLIPVARQTPIADGSARLSIPACLLAPLRVEVADPERAPSDTRDRSGIGEELVPNPDPTFRALPKQDAPLGPLPDEFGGDLLLLRLEFILHPASQGVEE